MTETHATEAVTPVFPPGRYGRRRAPQRRRPVLFAALVAVLLVVTGLISVKLYQQYGPDYSGEVVSYTDITDSQIRITFQVTVPEGEPARCALRARSYDGAQVGYADVLVDNPGGARQMTQEHLLATTAKPFMAEVLGCRPVE
ncbi:DUF4307 domain-containing protein [Melissospora conviva]|uniref:DUF4307 domain-containing protein n=1 Tax=Melissospora conviva TaxID=3388432 RepID=UPI003B7D64D9